MPELTWWAGITAFSVTTTIFVASTCGSFRFSRGSAMLRGLVAAGTLATITLIVTDLFARDALRVVALVVACALFAAAQALFWSARFAHGAQRPSAAFAHDSPERLVTGGPYRLLRHPFYVAYVCALAGGAVLAGSSRSFVATLAMTVVYILAARQEELLILGSALGPAYRRYKQRVGALVPQIGGAMNSLWAESTRHGEDPQHKR